MPFDYDQFYDDNPKDALGKPFPEFIEFFEKLSSQNISVLDMGAGQGRDAFFIAKNGHKVTAIDISPIGIKQINTHAKKHDLPIKGIVGDIEIYTPSQSFDIVLIDRTLHMLPQNILIGLFKKYLTFVKPNGYILIADEPENITDFIKILSLKDWKITFSSKSFVFAKK